MSKIYAPSEAEWQQCVIDCAQLNGWALWRDNDSRRNNPGFPDLVLIRPPSLLFVELKSETGKLRPEQAQMLEQLRACGADARVWRPSDFDNEVLPTLSRKRAKR